MKASVVERFNRTLKNDMWKQFTLNGNYRWIDLLPHLLSEYNARKDNWYETYRRNSRDRQLLTMVYSRIKIARFKASGRFGTRE